MLAVQGIVVIQITGLQIHLCDVTLRREPYILFITGQAQDNIMEGLDVLDLQIRIRRINRQQTATERTEP